MKPKKVAVIFLFILVLSTTFAFLNSTLVLATEAQKQKAEALFQILDNDNMSIVLAFSMLDAQNITVPNADTKYNQGLEQAEQAVSLMSEGKFSEASIEAVDAMQKFEETLRILEDALPVEPTETEVNAEELISLKVNITRTIEHVERLENLTVKAATAGFNTLTIEKRLGEVKQRLGNATRKLYARNFDGAVEELCIAKTLLDELTEPFARLTNLVTASNTEKYLQDAKIRVSVTKTNITLSATLTKETKEEAITALNNSEISLANARDSIDNNNIDEAIEELEEAKKWEEESNRVITAVAVTPTSVALTDESLTRAEITSSK